MHPERVKEIRKNLEAVQADLPALAASIAHLEAMLAMPTDERLTAMQQRYNEMEKERNDYAQNIVQLLGQQRHNAHLLISTQRELDSYAASWDALSDALSDFDPKAYGGGFEEDSQIVDAVKERLNELVYFRSLPEGEGDYRALLKERNELIAQLQRVRANNLDLARARSLVRELQHNLQYRDTGAAHGNVAGLFHALGIAGELDE